MWTPEHVPVGPFKPKHLALLSTLYQVLWLTDDVPGHRDTVMVEHGVKKYGGKITFNYIGDFISMLW